MIKIKNSHASKGRLLELLCEHVKIFTIPKLVCISVVEYEMHREVVLNNIASEFGSSTLAVRSCASGEDRKHETFAGAYHSELDVTASDSVQLAAAIEKVIASYRARRPLDSLDEIIFQEFVGDVSMSGVVFTRDLNSGSPYYVVNYDDVSGQTDTVTAGIGEFSSKTLYIHRDSIGKLKSDRFRVLMTAVDELEMLLPGEALDIEFAMGRDLIPYLLQVRPLSVANPWSDSDSAQLSAILNDAHATLRTRFVKIVGLRGPSTIFGQMPDWNPAEIIGRTPRALAFSLYCKLITDEAWALARRTMEYQAPIGYSLMTEIAGQPFIDTRLSLNSFIPNGLSEEIAEKIVDAGLNLLADNPSLHDKLEFDVAITAYSFDIDSKMEERLAGSLTPHEREMFKAVLKVQFENLITDSHPGSLKSAMHSLCRLDKYRYTNDKPSLGTAKFLELSDICVQHGTIPFAILARHAFIAKSLLSSLVQLKVLSDEESSQFLLSIKTVASDLVADLESLRAGRLSDNSFTKKYGHLRPGTYDILSNRYDTMIDFLKCGSVTPQRDQDKKFVLSKEKYRAIEELLKQHNFPTLTPITLLGYIEDAIVYREFAKFEFTRVLSDMLEVIAAFGESLGLARDILSHITINELLDAAYNFDNKTTVESLRTIADINFQKNRLSVSLHLPQLITEPDDVFVIPYQANQPTFITHQNITAGCVYLDGYSSEKELKGKIILIENADPGYDWIFGHAIVGLITRYGGTNSHMSIRCAEFGLPAAIGCGEKLFNTYVNCSVLNINCSARVVNIIS